MFDLDWPLIIKDLAWYLSGIDFLKGSKIREEEEENTNNTVEELCKESDLAAYKTKMTNIENPNAYAFCLNSFRVFEGKEPKSYNKKDLLNNADINHLRPENSMYIEE